MNTSSATHFWQMVFLHVQKFEHPTKSVHSNTDFGSYRNLHMLLLATDVSVLKIITHPSLQNASIWGIPGLSWISKVPIWWLFHGATQHSRTVLHHSCASLRMLQVLCCHIGVLLCLSAYRQFFFSTSFALEGSICLIFKSLISYLEDPMVAKCKVWRVRTFILLFKNYHRQSIITSWPA